MLLTARLLTFTHPGYYNEARILDPVTFNTITVLPNMPGAVNNFLAGRTYPLEGSAVLLPQHAPYTDPLEILICGGSTIGGGIALDNCISIAPEAANPTWTLERMVRTCIRIPSSPDDNRDLFKAIETSYALHGHIARWVSNEVPDQVTYQTQMDIRTYMILNGAHQGAAGFGLASDPNLNAVLYDPSQPVGQRMSILNSTTIARLYHSEATLLPDGRVLVSGSDPQTYYPNGSYVYPEELRLEVYIPPYLSQGLKQPQFTITQTDWAYSGQYSITVTLFQGTTSNMRISLLAGTFIGIRVKAALFTNAFSIIQYARKRHERRSDYLACVYLRRQRLYNHGATELVCISSRLASTIHPGWADSVAFRMGPHWWRPWATWKLAQLPGFHQAGSVRITYNSCIPVLLLSRVGC